MDIIVAPRRPMTMPTCMPNSISATKISESSRVADSNPPVLPTRLRAQNLVCRSLEPVAKQCPAGCHTISQMAISCAKGIRAEGSSEFPLGPIFQYNSVPSIPPEAKTDSYKGCQAMDVTSLKCPLRLHNSRMARMSYTLMSWSRLAVKSQFPLSFQATFVTVFLCPYRVLRAFPPARGSHSLTRLSLEPLQMTLDRGCQATVLTSHPWPSKTRSSRCAAQSQTRTVASSPHETNLVSAGEKLSP
mmetsp:Transcript_8227/g.14855  ORF Transcript_8227/g.14855 Transcript_8227/m.14855 type:complete len:245 (+) Transcript_8227:287-1021(+)